MGRRAHAQETEKDAQIKQIENIEVIFFCRIRRTERQEKTYVE
jgi:hypothetical protein